MQENTQSPAMPIDKMSSGFMLSQTPYSVAKLGIANFIGDGCASSSVLARAAKAAYSRGAPGK